ncbi:MAG: TetR/AcrR family transcriptional regulator [Lewinellaceae bacterium]|nr:TetR/AcrR family transcriptional regulator [Lewinellaceae bacterium]
MTKDLDTESRILEAAKRVFIRKGYAGARMQEIADEAGINKGLLHYYFRNKDNLFGAIFEEAFRELAPRTVEIFESDEPLFTKLEQFIDRYLDFLAERPYLPAFVIQEINNNPEGLLKKLAESGFQPNPMKLFIQIQMEIQKGNIRPVNPIHLVVNLISMCVFPFVGRPMLQQILQVGDAEYLEFMKMRKEVILDFVKNAILEEGGGSRE